LAIALSLARGRGSRADDTSDLLNIGRTVGPDDAQDDGSVVRVGGGGDVTVLAGALRFVVLIDVVKVAIVVCEHSGGVVERDAMLLEITPRLVLIPLELVV
jgi:hypothetical protein